MSQPIQEYEIDEALSGQRLDKALSGLAEELSRARAQKLIAENCVLVNGRVCGSASQKLKTGDVVRFEMPPLKESIPQPENIPLDVVFEDEHVIVINKPAGLVVHPGAGNHDGTLVNALLYHCGDELSGIGGVLRPGIVHRLDKETSGLMMAAKNDRAHQSLSAQLQDRTLSRIYQALVLRVPMPIKGAIEFSVGRDPRNRQKMAVNTKNSKDARTFYEVIERYSEALALVSCVLDTGRTHQIRVHMEAIKHPLIGDPVYGPQPTATRAVMKKAGYSEEVIENIVNFPRQALHAQQISFEHPESGEEMTFEVPLPGDFSNLLKLL